MSNNNSNGSKYRDAESGQYTTKKYADKHPKTTVKESAPKPPKK